jgi:hypothetical protein
MCLYTHTSLSWVFLSQQVIGALDEMEYFRHAVKANLERLCGVNLHLTMEAD